MLGITLGQGLGSRLKLRTGLSLVLFLGIGLVLDVRLWSERKGKNCFL